MKKKKGVELPTVRVEGEGVSQPTGKSRFRQPYKIYADFIAEVTELRSALKAAVPYVRYSKHEVMGDVEGNESDKHSVLKLMLAALAKTRTQLPSPTEDTDSPDSKTGLDSKGKDL